MTASNEDVCARPTGWHRVAATVGALTAALVVGNAALFLWAPGLVDSGFLGWLELPMGARLLLHLPLAMAVLIGPMIVLTTAGWVRGWSVDAARPVPRAEHRMRRRGCPARRLAADRLGSHLRAHWSR